MSETSRRQRLLEYAETGRLRRAVERDVDTDTADLIVDVCLRYAEPRRRPLVWKRPRAVKP